MFTQMKIFNFVEEEDQDIDEEESEHEEDDSNDIHVSQSPIGVADDEPLASRTRSQTATDEPIAARTRQHLGQTLK